MLNIVGKNGINVLEPAWMVELFEKYKSVKYIKDVKDGDAKIETIPSTPCLVYILGRLIHYVIRKNYHHGRLS